MNSVKDESPSEKIMREHFVRMIKDNSVYDDEKPEYQAMFMNRISMMMFLYQNELYQKILDIPGIIMEFGVRFGRNECIWTNLRGIYEPYNHSRKIVAFDTFGGFPEVTAEDGDHPVAKAGNLTVPENYPDFLTALLNYYESECPVSHKKKFELIKGDACKTLPIYLEENPQTIISFAYLDLDLHKPTITALRLIWDRIPSGGIVAFDELNFKPFEGETKAVFEFFEGKKLELRKSKFKYLLQETLRKLSTG